MVAVAYALANVSTAMSVPVVPNFTQGSMTSTNMTTCTTQETINSMDYNTGWQYSVTGSGVEVDGNLTPTGSSSISNTQITLD